MITRVDFLENVPIAQNGMEMSRTFCASDGWRIDWHQGAVILTHRDGRLRTVGGVGYVFTETMSPPAEPGASNESQASEVEAEPSAEQPQHERRVEVSRKGRSKR